MASSNAPSIAIVDLSPFLENCNQVKGNDSETILKSENYNNLKLDDQKRAALKLHEAFQDTGFAIVVNHGVEKEKIERLRKLSLEYFSFEIQKKSSLANQDSTIVSITNTVCKIIDEILQTLQ